MKVRYSYSSTYNFRPNELYGMGKESVDVIGPKDGISIEKFLELISNNSSIKFENAMESIYGTSVYVEREEWKNWIGQPMFYITNIKVEIIDEV